MSIDAQTTGQEPTNLAPKIQRVRRGFSHIEFAILILVLAAGVSLAYLSIETSFVYAFIAIFVIIAGLIIVQRPEIGLLIVIFLFPFEDLNQVVAIGPFSIIKLMSAALFAAYAFHYFVLNPGQKLVMLPQNFFIGALLLAALVSNLVAIDPDFAVSMTFKLLRMVALFVLVINIVRTYGGIMRVVWAMFAAGIASALYGMYEYYLRPDLLQDMRVSGPLDDPIGFSYTMVILLPLCWHIFTQSKHILIKLFSAGAGLLFIYAIILSGTRSGMLAAGLVILLIALLQKRPVLTISAAVALLVITLFLLPEQVQKRIGLNGELDAAAQTSNDRRLTYAVYGLELFLEHPFVGIGLGGFAESYSYSQYQHLQGNEDVRRVAHNMYIEIATGTGLFGFIPFILLLGTPLIALYRLERNPKYKHLHSIAKMLQVSLVAFLFVGLFSSSQYDKPLWLLLALSSVLPVIARQYEKEPDELTPLKA